MAKGESHMVGACRNQQFVKALAGEARVVQCYVAVMAQGYCNP